MPEARPNTHTTHSTHPAARSNADDRSASGAGTRLGAGSATGPQPMRWRVVDVVVASILGVACGLLFWAWSSSWDFISLPMTAYPPLKGLLTGVWVLAGPLGALIIRKPGAAIYVEVLAAAVSMVLGTQWGFQVIISGLVQGLGAEVVFAALRYRRFGLPTALLAGLGAGLFLAIGENIMYNAAWSLEHKVVYTVCAGASGLVLAGLVSWLLVRAIAATGALGSFAAGRGMREV